MNHVQERNKRRFFLGHGLTTSSCWELLTGDGAGPGARFFAWVVCSALITIWDKTDLVDNIGMVGAGAGGRQVQGNLEIAGEFQGEGAVNYCWTKK